jgi:hypothetical protein
MRSACKAGIPRASRRCPLRTKSGGLLEAKGASSTPPVRFEPPNARSIHRLVRPSVRRDTAWAMSEENVEVVRRGYEAFNRGDLDGMVADFAPTFEYVASGAVPAPGVCTEDQRV